MDYIREIMVWSRMDDVSAKRYCCLKNLSNEKYAVQSVDFFRLPFDAKTANNFSRQFCELFIEVSAIDRCEWFPTLMQAIEAHNLEFS